MLLTKKKIWEFMGRKRIPKKARGGIAKDSLYKWKEVQLSY